MTSPKFHDLFGGPPREPESELTQREMDLAALGAGGDRGDHAAHGAPRAQGDRRALSVPGRRRGAQLRGQRQDPARGHLRRHLDPAGGRRRRRRPGRGAATSGTSYLDNPRQADGRRDGQSGSYLGPGLPADADRDLAARGGHPVPRAGRARERARGRGRADRATRRSSAGSAAGWSSARAPSAPAASSAMPRSTKMQSVMNLKIKYRESFRPFAPQLPGRGRLGVSSSSTGRRPTCCWWRRCGRSGARRCPPTRTASFGIDKLNVPRSDVPAITHVDYSARVQTVSAEDHPAATTR